MLNRKQKKFLMTWFRFARLTAQATITGFLKIQQPLNAAILLFKLKKIEIYLRLSMETGLWGYRKPSSYDKTTYIISINNQILVSSDPLRFFEWFNSSSSFNKFSINGCIELFYHFGEFDSWEILFQAVNIKEWSTNC